MKIERIVPERLCGVLVVLGVFGIVGQISVFYIADHPYYSSFIDCLFKRCSIEMLSESLFFINLFVLISAGIGLLGWNRTYGFLWAWLCGQSVTDDVASGIESGRSAFRKRFGNQSNVSDEVFSEMYETEGVVQAGIIEAGRQDTCRLVELGITGEEAKDALRNNSVAKIIYALFQDKVIDDSLKLDAAWEALQQLLVLPIESNSYPDKSAVLKAYAEWISVVGLLKSMPVKADTVYLIGGLDFASQEFIIQMCLRGANTKNLPMRDIWLSLFVKIGKLYTHGVLTIVGKEA